MKNLHPTNSRPAATSRGSRKSTKPSRILPLPATNGAPAVSKPTAQTGIPVAALFASTPKGGHHILAYILPSRPYTIAKVFNLLLPASTSLSQRVSMGHVRLKASYSNAAHAIVAWKGFLAQSGYRTPSRATLNKKGSL